MENKTASEKKRKTIMMGLGVAVTGVLGYFGWQYWKKKKQLQIEDSMSDYSPSPGSTDKSTPSKPTPNNTKVTPKSNDNFPLKQGSKGENVKALQQALIAKYGAGVLPKYGADGAFGKELADALKKQNLPPNVDASTLNVIASANALNATQVAGEVYQSITKKDFKAVQTALKKLNSKADYTAVSTAFQTYRIGGVRQTLVNGLLKVFTDSAQKQQLQFEFIRMGLKYDGSKWSLSGIDGTMLITTVPTTIWKDQLTPIPVNQSVVLGREVTRRNEHVVFENNGQHFLVKADSVNYYSN